MSERLYYANFSNDSSVGRDMKDWQQELKQVIKHPDALFDYLQLDKKYLDAAIAATALFELRAPIGFLDRIEKGNINDPLLKQIMPIGLEQKKVSGFSIDPLNEKKYNPLPGVLHKYKTRILLTLTGSCPINCRYCFRRHFAYNENQLGQKHIEAVKNYLLSKPDVNEVIFSGGEPLLANNDLLKKWLDELGELKQIKRFRIHTRMPIVIPSRIDDEFINVLKSAPKKVTMVVHCNHPNEIDENIAEMFLDLHAAGILVLNQSVLLKDVNDNAKTLVALSEKLFESNAMPYYLHLLDPVAGTAHFNVEKLDVQNIYRELQANLPGFLLPKLVRELSGEESKTIIL